MPLYMTAATIDKDTTMPSFSYLKSFEERCSRLSNLESEFLLSFWSEKLQCFQIVPNLSTERVSITTTCISLLSMLDNPLHWKNIAAWKVTSNEKISIKNVIQSILQSPWRTNDVFQTQLIALTLSKFHGCSKNDEKYESSVRVLLDNRPRLALHRNQENSVYIRYHIVKTLLTILEEDMIPDSILEAPESKEDSANCNKEDLANSSKDKHGKFVFALERANLMAFDELCRQLAFYNSGDSANFDVIMLAYSLLSYWDTANSLYLTSFARGVVPTTNIKLIKSALEVIFASQAIDGTWRKGEPINQVISNSRADIGNNYVFFFDLVSSILSSIGSKQPMLLAPYLTHLERCLEWAESNIQQEMLTLPSTKAGEERKIIVKGWRSNHLGSGGAVAWCTAQVFSGVNQLRKLLKTIMTNLVLTEFNGKIAQYSSNLPAHGNERDFIQLMDSDLSVNSMKTSLKEIIQKRLLQPQARKEKELYSSLLGEQETVAAPAAVTSVSNGNDNYAPLYSLILFGPPGTAKTTICTSIANYLGWNFLTIDTACFLANGLENIASRMTYIFNRLNSLERTIILFDEIEEFCLDRENPTLGMESRLLTTAMLTQLNDLRRKQSSIFIVATNRLRSFDSAVIRPGRFDMLLFVGTPNLSSRIQRLEKRLKSQTSFSSDKIQATVQLTERYFYYNWNEIRFLSFAENENLLNSIIDLAVGDKLNEENIAMKANNIMRTATIQGPVKSEYEASEALSRI
eukprot:gene11004-11991_t